MNPIFQNFSNQNRQMSMIEQFKDFASGFRGDPKQQVQELLRTGKMTQEEFREYSQMANDFRSLFRR